MSSIKEVPLHSGELAGLEMLRANANLMFREGKLIYIIKENRFPLFNKMQIELHITKKMTSIFGWEVIIKIRSATGYLVNVIPLPMITYNMETLQANLDNNVLNIIFEKKL